VLFFSGLLYFLLILRLAFGTPDLIYSYATGQWNSLIKGWFILNLLILVLSSAQWVRFLSRLQTHPARFIVAVYTSAATLCSLLLILPVSLQEGVDLSLLDALFTSVSAISGAGLLTINVSETFSMMGQTIILLFIQAGGIGIITFSGVLLLVIGRELGVHEKVIHDETEKIYFMGSLKNFALFVAAFMFIVESIGVVLIYPTMQGLFDQPHVALFHSIFHVVSAICTAGISTLPTGLVELDGAAFPLTLLSAITFLGALGAPTIIQIVKVFDWRSPLRKISAYAKFELILMFGFLFLGFLVLWLIEASNPFHETLWSSGLHSFIQSSMRATGFSSMPIDEFTLPGLFVLLSLLIVGGAPISTAGGLKTATVGIILVFVWSFLRGQSDANFMGRRIPPVLFIKAVSIVVIFGLLGLAGFLALYLTQELDALSVLFETFSALAVCGWSLGATTDVNTVGKTILILLMMIGRIGMLTTIYFFIMRRKRRNYQYAQGEFYVG